VSTFRPRRLRRFGAAIATTLALAVSTVDAQRSDYLLSQPVHDFANVVDAQSEADLDRMIRALQSTTGDAVVVVTVPTIAPYADIRELAVELFENQGRGIGQKGSDNGLLIVVAPSERQVWVEVGYGLEQWITDGFAGETSRQVMAPEFRSGRYGPGLVAGTARFVARIAQGRNVTLKDVELPAVAERPPVRVPFSVVVLVFLAILLLSRKLGGPGRSVRRWGRGGWSGWSSGVGPFGGMGWSGRGGFGGGGFGGGFGGFGGGRSGGGGGGARW
jgi:uncharacterized protein